MREPCTNDAFWLKLGNDNALMHSKTISGFESE